MLEAKIAIIFVFGCIFWQDYRQRLVFWFLFPLFGILGFWIQKNNVTSNMILINTSVNLILITCVLLILFVYTKIILKKEIAQSLGAGDVLFFLFLCPCFALFSFFVLFVFSLLFSLFFHLILKSRYNHDKTVPLAGYMSLFFAMVYVYSIFNHNNIIFAY